MEQEREKELECGPMPNVMVALPNIGGALCSTPQSLADAHYQRIRGFTTMRYINLRFTYLLTYLLTTCHAVTLPRRKTR